MNRALNSVLSFVTLAVATTALAAAAPPSPPPRPGPAPAPATGAAGSQTPEKGPSAYDRFVKDAVKQPGLFTIYRKDGHVFLELGDRPMAAKAVKRLGAFARSFPIGRPRHLLAQGRLQALNGKRPAAEKLMRTALDEARRLALPRDVALVEHHLDRLTGTVRQAAPV